MSVPSKILKIFGFEQQQNRGWSANYGKEHKDKSCQITLFFEKIINLFIKTSIEA